MSIFTSIKDIFSKDKTKYPIDNVITGDKEQHFAQPIYMDRGSYLSCRDKTGRVNVQTRIVPEHIDFDLGEPITFPRFSVVKIGTKENGYGMYARCALILDADETPVENSKNLLTSGTLYNIIADLQAQIANLQEQIDSLKK